MRKGMLLAVATLFLATPHSAAAQQASHKPQLQSSTSPSHAKPDPLVEAARKAREAQKTAPKSSTVFTNDNIPTTPGAVSVVGNTEAEASGKPSVASADAGKANSPAQGQGDEAAWRKRFADARHKLQQDQTELSLLQRESNQLQVQYYPDPTKALMQSVDRSDIIKNQKAIDDKIKQVDADRQAISALEDALRQAGGDPGWARE